MSETAEIDQLLDQTLYLTQRIYEDPETPPTPLDLHSACAIGNYECVQDTISSGADINACNKAGWTPLMYASYVGHDTVVNLLLEAGADAAKGTPNGLSPLMVAAGCGNESVCYFLLQSGATVDARDSNGYTALSYAVRQGHQFVVQLLLEADADVAVREEHGYTPLMLAALEGDEIIVDILIACGSDVCAKDNDGFTARSLAFKNDHVRTVSILDNALYMLEDGENSDGEDGDLFSGPKEMEAWSEIQAVKKAIQTRLGPRSGVRWSLPPDMLGNSRRGSAPAVSSLRRQRLRVAMSMPEQAHPPHLVDEGSETLTAVEEGGRDERLVEFLDELGLSKYMEVFEEHEIDLHSLMSFNDEDLKKIGIKLLGPRRKLSLALSELKEREAERSGGGGGEGRGGGPTGGGGSISGRGGKGRKGSRPQLKKQPTTELQDAYHQAIEQIEYLEGQLAQEHQLRSTTDSYLVELQRTRQQAMGFLGGVKDSQTDLQKHCNALKKTQGKLTTEVDCLRLLSTSPVVDPHQLHHIYSEIMVLGSRLGMELEAMSRTVDSSRQQVDSLTFQLKSNS